jgi:RNA 2',3'-cyclic 3'-phosphodiesterase
VAGSEPLRLFCALRLPAPTIERISSWQAAELEQGRVVPPAHLHITLAFLGSRPPGDLAAVAAALRSSAQGAGRITFSVLEYRETASAGMLVLADEGQGAALAASLQERLESGGLYRPERRPWLPHLTVVRFRERPRLHPPLPDFGDLTPSDAAVFMSTLRSGGAQYDVLETVRLGG